MANTNLTKAKKAKNDEFYTQYNDIQKEINAYIEYNPDVFREKTVYCNCDDPFESNFFRFFVLNFKTLGLKRLISTSYKPSPIANTQLELFGDDKTLKPQKGRPKVTANRFIINEVSDYNNDGSFDLKDISEQLKANKNNEWAPLDENGDFRSAECIELLKQADIVVTNPPFSLFREYVTQLFEYKKKFLIIGNMNAITYKEVFSLMKENSVWLGVKSTSQSMFFKTSNKEYANRVSSERPEGSWWRRIDEEVCIGINNSCWFTNLDHGRRHQRLPLMTEAEIIKFVTKKSFIKYDNYNAIEVPLVKNIPSDFEGIMGVPISFMDKYNPEQFEIIGSDYEVKEGKIPTMINANWKGKLDRGYVNGERIYSRLFIKHKK